MSAALATRDRAPAKPIFRYERRIARVSMGRQAHIDRTREMIFDNLDLLRLNGPDHFRADQWTHNIRVLKARYRDAIRDMVRYRALRPHLPGLVIQDVATAAAMVLAIGAWLPVMARCGGLV